MNDSITSSRSMPRSVSIRWKLSLVALFGAITLIALSIYLINQQYQLAYDSRKEALKNHVEIAASLVQWAYKQETSGAVSHDAAQAIAIKAINEARYGAKEYFWINDMDTKLVVHPFRPDLNGKDVSDIKDPQGNAVFVRFVETVRKDGQGYLSYLWPKPGMDQPVEKVSYVLGFKPWNWVIGSGLYMDDLRADFYARLRSMSVVLILMIVLTIAITVVIARSILVPLNRVVRVATAIGQGRYDEPLGDIGGDEVGQLLQAMGDTQKALQHAATAATFNLRLRTAVEVGTTNVMIADAGNNVIFMNKAVETMLSAAESDIRKDLPNFTTSKVMGSNIDIFHKNPAHQRDMLAKLRDTYRTQIAVGGRIFGLVATPITDAQGERVGTVVEWSDKTAEIAARDLELELMIRTE